jgi:hypothetical protein
MRFPRTALVVATLVAGLAWAQLGPGEAGGATATAAKNKVSVSTKRFQFDAGMANVPQRLEVRCKRGYRPIGGGLSATPSVGTDGSGLYPTSSERLGAQGGWHVTATLFNETSPVTVARSALLQAFCVKLKGDIDPVVTTALVDPGDFRTVVSTCPAGRTLLSGGYLSTQFFPDKGVYATESRRIDDRTWEATAYGVATGQGGSVSSIAYCLGGSRPVLSEQSVSGAVGANGLASATTPPCPGNQPLVAGGFGGPATGAIRFFDPHANGDGTWSTSGFGVKGGGPFTGYGYCLLRSHGPKDRGKRVAKHFSTPIVFSSYRQPPSPHGSSYTIDVTGSSVGKLRGNRSHSPLATRCLANRRVTIESKYRDPASGPLVAGQTVVTRSDAKGDFSAQVPVTVPDHRTQPAEIGLTATFTDTTTRRVRGAKVSCVPGGELRPTYQPVGS